MKEYLFVFGRDPELSFLELRQFLDGRKIHYIVKEVKDEIAVVALENLEGDLANTLGGTVRIGEIIGRDKEALRNFPFILSDKMRLSICVYKNSSLYLDVKTFFKTQFKKERLRYLFSKNTAPSKLKKDYLEILLFKDYIAKTTSLFNPSLYKERDKRRFQVFQVPIANYGFFWGNKEYRLDPTRVGSWEKAVAISDLHFRFEDKVALGATLGFIEEYQPDVIFVNGDVPDFPDISRFSNSPLDLLTDEDVADLSSLVLESKQQGKIKKYLKPRLQRDFERIYEFFKELRRICPKARIVWIFGNHDHRMQGYVDEDAKQLAGVRRPGDKDEVLALAELTKVREFGVEIVYSGKNESSTTYGDLLVGHFYKVSAKSSFTAAGLVRQKHSSLVQPHVHRMGAYYKTLLDGTVLVGVEMGCLCRLDPEYMQYPNWQHGFVVIHKKKNSGRFYLQPIHIVDGAFLFAGKRYGRPSNHKDETDTKT